MQGSIQKHLGQAEMVNCKINLPPEGAFFVTEIMWVIFLPSKQEFVYRLYRLSIRKKEKYLRVTQLNILNLALRPKSQVYIRVFCFVCVVSLKSGQLYNVGLFPDWTLEKRIKNITVYNEFNSMSIKTMNILFTNMFYLSYTYHSHFQFLLDVEAWVFA